MNTPKGAAAAEVSLAMDDDAILDAHARPPESLRVLFKAMQKMSVEDIDSDPRILDFNKLELTDAQTTRKDFAVGQVSVRDATQSFLDKPDSPSNTPVVFEVNSCPGLLVYSGLLSAGVQATLLDRIMHRDLSKPEHLTNVHLFHEMIYPRGCESISDDASRMLQSFFTMNPDTTLQPKDPRVHKPMSIAQMLRRKLRWLTLGGQYDWTNKVYPSEEPPAFPEDIAKLLRALFPSVDAQAAIVNFYTPNDTLSVHRDVSEECSRALISISIGCDALFLVGNADGSQAAVIRLRSGDAVLMSGISRYAWHGVPKVIADTCPSDLADWPASATADPRLEKWRGWLRSKRINLNVRQMKEIP